jgi:hypothetical protein
VINPETIKLPVWVIGVGLIHVAALALVLPMLITLPAPTSIERKVEMVDVELAPAAQPAPKIDDVDQTAALPASPQPEPEVGETAAEPVDEPSADAPAAVANVEPEAAPTAAPVEPEPSAPPVEQAEPASETPAPASAVPKKSKVDGKAKRAKAARPAPKKPAIVRATPKPKPVYRRTSQDVAKKGLIPFKGSWSQLLGGPTPVPAKR